MISAFKHPLVAALLGVCSFTSYASNCALVSITPMHIDEQTTAVKLAAINGQPPRYEQAAYLAPGRHTINVEKHDLSDTDRPEVGVMSTIGLEVEGGKQYILGLTGKKNNHRVVLLSASDIECNSEGSKIIAAKAVTEPGQALPKALEYRLRRLMNKLAIHHGALAGKSNLLPPSRMEKFGTIFDDDNRRKDVLKVLVVTPYSQANRLGLHSGDEIVALGGKAVDRSSSSGAAGEINRYLRTIEVGQKIEITVRRKGQTITLDGTYHPVDVPEVFYTLGQ